MPAVSNAQWPMLQRTIEQTSVPPTPRPSWIARAINKIFPGGLGLLQKGGHFPNGVYILAYHSVVDPDHREPWEMCYRKGETTVAQLRTQLAFMLDHMTPIALSAAPGLWADGGPKMPYFAITFDDGFTNNRVHAHPVIQELGLKPTLFVNADFAARKQWFFRVLSAVLVHGGFSGRLVTLLRQKAPHHRWSDDGKILLNEMKNFYVVDIMEDVITETYWECLGDPDGLNIHLDRDGALHLQRSGWEMGNHTRSHRLLSHQTLPQITAAIEDNAAYWGQQGVPLIDFLAYPVGRAMDVNPAVNAWMQGNPAMHGIFANGGVNFSLRRTEWLRFSFGSLTSPEQLEKAVYAQIQRTLTACHILQEKSPP
ncbi:MAG: polysaccharide deacetylase family protein [Nitrospirae bacterium]|nr:polysaccharide deacetylase family protein [Magnetococcales bacterium]HAT49233.1 hypothetical protein [Alphaproteobacteria bacterium]